MANKNLFNSVKINVPGRSFFDLTHDHKTTFNMGNLVPILNMECVPGDSFKIGADSLIRFAPLISPVMHRMDVTIHYFYVPNRILWRNWDDFISRKNPALVHPYLTFAGAGEGTLSDYLGVPSTINNTIKLNALPYAAYQKIYNDYYRDQNLIAPIIGEDEILIDGNNNGNLGALATIRKRAWQHDYFTSMLPTTQFGSVSEVPVTVDFPALTVSGGATIPQIGVNSGDISVNDFRRANKLQEFKELLMRVGRRYKEYIQGVFGVDPGDARLNRPEYITGVKAPITISEVLNTAGVDGSNPQGAMAGHGVAYDVGAQNQEYFCREHGWLIGIISVLPLPSYQDGVHRSLHRRNDSLDYYIPQFANIGEQEVYMSELRAASANPDTIVGYNPRYSDLKYMPNRISGNFRSSLDFWHAGRKFTTDPALNQTFIEMDSASVDRMFAVKPTGSTHSIYATVLNKIEAVRPMPKFGTPSL